MWNGEQVLHDGLAHLLDLCSVQFQAFLDIISVRFDLLQREAVDCAGDRIQWIDTLGFCS